MIHSLTMLAPTWGSLMSGKGPAPLPAGSIRKSSAWSIVHSRKMCAGDPVISAIVDLTGTGSFVILANASSNVHGSGWHESKHLVAGGLRRDFFEAHLASNRLTDRADR